MTIRILKALFVVVLVAVPVLACLSLVVDAVTLIANPAMLDWGEVPFLTFSFHGGFSVEIPTRFFFSTLFIQMFAWLFCFVGWSLEGSTTKTWLHTTWKRFEGLSLLWAGIAILAVGSMAYVRGPGATLAYGMGWILLPILCGVVLGLFSLVLLMALMVVCFLFLEGLRLLRGKRGTSVSVA